MEKAKYELLAGKHHAEGTKYSKGDIITLSEKQAKSLVNKVRFIEAVDEDDTPTPSREEVITYLETEGIEFDEDATLEELIELAE